jgi:hypothetical protein
MAKVMVSPKATPTPPIPPPAKLRGFPHAESVRATTPLGAGNTRKFRKRWRDKKTQSIYEWDYRHGTVEKWDDTGREHLGDFDPETGALVAPPDPSRPPILTEMDNLRETESNEIEYRIAWYMKADDRLADKAWLESHTETDVQELLGLLPQEDTVGCFELTADETRALGELADGKPDTEANAVFIEALARARQGQEPVRPPHDGRE